VVPVLANRIRSLDFMSDSLPDGRTFRTLNVIADFNHEALWIKIDPSPPAERVV
jgi:putative transposase